MRSSATRMIPALVAVTLIILAATTAGAVAALGRENAQVADLRSELAQVGEIRDAVSDLAFAEAAYRRAPGEDSWSQLGEAMTALRPLLNRVRGEVSRSDQVTLSNLVVLHQRYVNQTQATRGQPANGTDDRVAGPALDAMRTLLQAVIDRYRRDLTAATEQEGGLITQMWILLPSAFVVTFAVLAWALTLSARERRRLTDEADEARTRALRDGLTGLPNRAALNSALLEALAPQRPGPTTDPPALILVDLDGFKPVNDTYGHPAGDQVLQEVADRLRACTRNDDLAARLGGDEFAILLTAGSSTTAVSLRIEQAFAPPFNIDGNHVHVGASIGSAQAPSTSCTPDELMREADQALYRAKRNSTPRRRPGSVRQLEKGSCDASVGG